MGNNAESQAGNVQPPRRGEILAISVSTTATSYSLAALSLAGTTPEAVPKRRLEVFLAMQADGGNVYYSFSQGAQTDLDNTAAIAVGGAVAYANTYGAKLVDGAVHDVRLNRTRDTHLTIKTSTGTAILRMWASSESES